MNPVSVKSSNIDAYRSFELRELADRLDAINARAALSVAAGITSGVKLTACQRGSLRILGITRKDIEKLQREGIVS
jgi:hypothetical protein